MEVLDADDIRCDFDEFFGHLVIPLDNKGEWLIQRSMTQKEKPGGGRGPGFSGDKGFSGFLRFSQKPTLRTLSNIFTKSQVKSIMIHMN